MSADPITGAPTIEGQPADWTGSQWVSGTTEAAYQNFRRAFVLDQVVASSLLQITADDWYRVCINGVWVGDGPRRGKPSVYRTYQIGAWLQAGENVVTVETYKAGGGSRFLCRLDGMAGPAGWRCAPETIRAEETLGSTLLSPMEVVDLRTEPAGWMETGFDDSAWTEAVLSDLEEELVADPSPPEARSMARPVEVVTVMEAIDLHNEDPCGNLALRLAYEPWETPTMSEIGGLESFVEADKGPVTIRPRCQPTVAGYYGFHRDGGSGAMVRSPTIVLDFGQLINGNFSFEIESEKEAQLDIGYAQVMIGGRLPTVLYAGDTTWGNKADRVFLRAGRQRWESFHWEQARYIQLTFRELQGTVKIHQFGIVAREAHLPTVGSFTCSDKVLTDLWQATVRTVAATTCDLFTDNCIREKLAFGGECGTRSLMTCWVASGNPMLARHFIRQFTHDPEASQRYLAYSADQAAAMREKAPVHFFHPLQLWNALSVYRLYASPEAYEEDGVLPAFRAYMAFLEGLVGDAGLISEHPGHPWMDWVPGAWSEAWGGGTGAPQNLFLCLLMRGLADAKEGVGETKRATDLRSRAEDLARVFHRRFWNGARGLYADVVIDGEQRSEHFSEHTNALALLAGLGSDGRDGVILEALAAEADDVIQADSAFTHFVAEACFMVGRGDLGLHYLHQRFAHMLEMHPEPTLWEERAYLVTIREHKWQGRYRSLAQSSTAVPAYLLTRHLLGVRPTAAGFAECVVAPQPAGLTWAEGVVPTPFGKIEIRWELSEGRFSLEISIPTAIIAHYELPDANEHWINGQQANLGGLVR